MIQAPLIILCETAASVFKHRRETLLSFFGNGIDLCNDCSGKKHLFPHLSKWLAHRTLAVCSPHNRLFLHSCRIVVKWRGGEFSYRHLRRNRGGVRRIAE